MPTRPDEPFLEAVCADPDDVAPRLMYADWLTERGDPRGEFIRLQCLLEEMPVEDNRRWALLVRERQLVTQHGKGWAGPTRRLAKQWRFRRGFVEAVTLSAEDFLRHGELLFQTAPLREVRLTHAEERIEELADCPHVSRVRGLDLRHTPGLTPQRLRPLMESRHLTGLRSLGLRGTGLCNGPGIRYLSGCQALTELESLDLGDFRRDILLGRHNALRRGRDSYREWVNRANANAMADESMQAVVESPCMRKLRSLSLRGFGNRCSDGALEVLLASPFLAHLEELDLSWVRPVEGNGILRRLAGSPFAGNLRTLCVRRGGALVGLATHSAAGPPTLRHLTTLEMEDVRLVPQTLPEAAWPCPNLVVLRLVGSAPTLWGSSVEAAWRGIPGSLSKLPHLACLDLLQTVIGPSGMSALLASPVASQLRWLAVGNRGGHGSRPLSDQGACDLAASPSLTRLVHLDLSNHDLTDNAATALSLSPHLQGLLSLNLWHNRIGTSGAHALADGFPSLRFLDLRANPLLDSAKRHLRERFGAGVRYGRGTRLSDDPPGGLH